MLEDMFTIIGNVRSAQIVLDAVAGDSRRFGLVEMSTEEEARDGIRYFNGQVKEDLTLVVRENVPHVHIPRQVTRRSRARK